jgi:hypothetical protein
VKNLTAPASDQSISSQQDFLASHLATPGSDEARMMTATSGRRCLESYGKWVHDTSLVRMLLESSVWASEKCYLTWRLRATVSDVPLFQLVPSTPHTEGTASGLWPTATSRDYKDTGDCARTVEENCLLGRAVGPSLEKGNLNADWVELLMGFPLGWTDLGKDKSPGSSKDRKEGSQGLKRWVTRLFQN